MKEFKFPDVGEGIHEGKIVKWHVKEGDAVKADDVLVEVETDKAIVELPSPATGKIASINFHEGTEIRVGETLVTIDDGSPSITQATAKPQEQKPATMGLLPQVPKVLSDFRTRNPPNPKLETGDHVALSHKSSISFGTGDRKPDAQNPNPLATPSTRKLARELGIEISRVQGTGPAGRISDDDVRKAAAATTGGPQKTSPPAKLQPSPISGEEVRIPLTGYRKAIAERMSYSKAHIPHACGMDLVDVTRLVALREKEKHQFEPKGVKLTYLPFIVKACVIALRKYPTFNAHFDNDTNEVIAKRDINIGIAVDTPDGLTAPVIKNADHKSVIEVAQEIEHLAMLAREKKLTLDEVKGGTFTITNVGSVGGMFSTPIINPPEIAILGIHRIRDMPLVIDGKIEARKVMGISMCFDHRVVDGAIATEFMNEIKQHLEDPDLMLVDMI